MGVARRHRCAEKEEMLPPTPPQAAFSPTPPLLYQAAYLKAQTFRGALRSQPSLSVVVGVLKFSFFFKTLCTRYVI